MQAISLFSNCGAGDVGYRNAGFTFEVMAELERQRLDVCLLNHPDATGIPGDLRITWPEVVGAWYLKHELDERPTLLCSCPPCQGMSSARSGMGNGFDPAHGARDERNLLVEVVANSIEQLRPRIVVLENVPHFLTKMVMHPDTQKGITAPRLLHERVGKDYFFFPVVVDLADYGVPQTRKRTFITLVRRGEPCLNVLMERGVTPYPKPTHAKKRVSFAAHFAPLNLPELNPLNVATAVCPNDPLHAVTVLSGEEGLRRYAMIAATAQDGGSAWHNKACVSDCDNTDVKIGPDECRCPQCGDLLLRPVVKDKKTQEWRLIKGFRSTSYRRMKLHEEAATVTTASGHTGSDVNIHPTQNRLLSPRECAELQTFPQDFQWGKVLEDGSLGKIREMIGEAVPPLFTLAHGQVLQALLANNVGPLDLLPASDSRCKVGRKRFATEQQLDLLFQAPNAECEPDLTE